MLFVHTHTTHAQHALSTTTLTKWSHFIIVVGGFKTTKMRVKQPFVLNVLIITFLKNVGLNFVNFMSILIKYVAQR